VGRGCPPTAHHNRLQHQIRPHHHEQQRQPMLSPGFRLRWGDPAATAGLLLRRAWAPTGPVPSLAASATAAAPLMKQVWDRLRSELLLDIIEWSDAIPGAPDPSGDTLAWRFCSGDSADRSRAIRNGAQLIVREGQWAVFLDEGRIADAFGPGRHTLSTANLPLLTSLLCLPSGFESPFKAEVVFVATRLFSDLKWGTRQPLLLRDPELGPVRLRGFGTYSLRVNDPAWLVREVSGASERLDLASLQDPVRSMIVSRLADVLGRCGCPVFDLASRYETLARDLRLGLIEDAQQVGLEIPSLRIEALTLPPEVEAALVRRSVRLVDGATAQASVAPAAAMRHRAPPPPPPPLPSPPLPKAPAGSALPVEPADGGPVP
jgi:hypothetical protein